MDFFYFSSLSLKVFQVATCYTNIPIFYLCDATNSWKMFSSLKQDHKKPFVSVEDNTGGMWNKATLKRQLSCVLLSKKRNYIKRNIFSFSSQRLLKRFLDLKMKLKMLPLFLSLKDNTVVLNQQWIGKDPIQFFLNRMIYIRVLSSELFL